MALNSWPYQPAFIITHYRELAIIERYLQLFKDTINHSALVDYHGRSYELSTRHIYHLPDDWLRLTMVILLLLIAIKYSDYR